MTAGPSIHANCVVAGEHGVLIRGPSGAGKSSFSVRLIGQAETAGLFARLVSDDRTHLEARNGRLVATAAPQIAGMIERRGVGVLTVPWLGAAVVRLVVDLATGDRMPEVSAFTCEVNGIALMRLAVEPASPDGPALVLMRLGSGFEPGACDPLALAFARQRGKIARAAT